MSRERRVKRRFFSYQLKASMAPSEKSLRHFVLAEKYMLGSFGSPLRGESRAVFSIFLKN